MEVSTSYAPHNVPYSRVSPHSRPSYAFPSLSSYQSYSNGRFEKPLSYQDPRQRLPPTPPAEKMSLPPISTLFDLTRERQAEEGRPPSHGHARHQYSTAHEPRTAQTSANYDPRLMPPTPPVSGHHEQRRSPMMQIPHQPVLPSLQSSPGYQARPPMHLPAEGYHAHRPSLHSERSSVSSYSHTSAQPASPESTHTRAYTTHSRRRTLGEHGHVPPPLQTTTSPQSPHSTVSSASATTRAPNWRYDPYPVGGTVPTPHSVHQSPTSPMTAPAGAVPTTLSSSSDRYVCTQCSKAFSRPSSLRIHSYSHTGEKPFMCPHTGCGKAFSVRSNMKRHERGCHVGGGPAGESQDTMSVDEEEEEE